MSSSHDEPFDPAEPALIVTVGNTARKHRPLKRPVVVLGRAHGCDIGLTAPDISSVHCLIYRGPGGLHIRDCQSRSGTHLNGLPVVEEVLRDGDTIQVGPFSFEAYIPPGSVPSPATAEHDAAAAGSERRATTTLAEDQAELDGQAEFLRRKAAEYEQRARRLEEAERALAADRASLDQETAERQKSLGQAEQQLARRQASLEHDIETQWRAWQRHQEEHEAALCQVRAEKERIGLGSLAVLSCSAASERDVEAHEVALAHAATEAQHRENRGLRELLALREGELLLPDLLSGEPQATTFTAVACGFSRNG